MRLSEQARRLVEETIEAEVACGDSRVADALRVLLTIHDAQPVPNKKLCRHRHACASLGSCPRDPACNH